MIEAPDIEEFQSLLEQSEQAYRTFRPRPDQPDRFDQQESFYHSAGRGVTWMVGGNGAGTTEIALAKVAKLLLRDQPPPRKDTPFWIISGSYEQVMETAWKEKLYGHGHIPGSEIDWGRIAWYRPNDGWPYRVPLKPWPGFHQGRNWMLEFKSYEQGRSKLQARSIGGFLFIEQFPWALLEEVLRGCREYNFPGSKLCEFTPVDPYLSSKLEEMEEKGELPEGWQVFRANTECAMEAGHVSKEWFNEFFGMIPEEMLLTRMIGAWASYEGAIYQSFNPHVHLAGDDRITFPPGVDYRRSIDWGFGPDNAFVCLWAYRNGLGQWHIFDEYYSTDQNRTILDHLEEIRQRHEWPDHSPHHGTTWCDPSDPGSLRLSHREGFAVSPARNAVLEGIDCVRSLLKVVPGLGQPRILIHKDRCPHLSRQMRTYRWLRGSDSGLNPRDGRPEPLKKDDHAVDALRYLCFSEMHETGRAPASIPRYDNFARHGIRLDRIGGNGYSHGVADPSRGGDEWHRD